MTYTTANIGPYTPCSYRCNCLTIFEAVLPHYIILLSWLHIRPLALFRIDDHVCAHTLYGEVCVRAHDEHVDDISRQIDT